mmetsp:Transcript_18305/g.39102  ORF Transcript_18305/g.39102 Transcript_18305/m.39102 type:complete len:229 (-) Transcript_18305:345-1031(-)
MLGKLETEKWQRIKDYLPSKAIYVTRRTEQELESLHPCIADIEVNKVKTIKRTVCTEVVDAAAVNTVSHPQFSPDGPEQVLSPLLAENTLPLTPAAVQAKEHLAAVLQSTGAAAAGLLCSLSLVLSLLLLLLLLLLEVSSLEEPPPLPLFGPHREQATSCRVHVGTPLAVMKPALAPHVAKQPSMVEQSPPVTAGDGTEAGDGVVDWEVERGDSDDAEGDDGGVAVGC